METALKIERNIIYLFDENGAVVQTIPCPVHIKRQSQRGPAEQRLINKASAANPAIVAARIGTATFKCRNGQSIWTGFVGE